MDNREHVVGAEATTIAHLLRAAPELCVLATGREVLGCSGEYVAPVPPMRVPEPSAAGEVAGVEAVELPRERAGAIGAPIGDAQLGVASQLCRRLDGIPLAIELAAGRLNTLTVEDMLARLDDRFRLLTVGGPDRRPAHRTMREVIGWSYQLRDGPERLLWTRASVFAGGFTLEAVEEVCSGQGLERGDVLDALTGLIRQSLVTVVTEGQHTRYRMLETLRQYGLRLLAGRDAARSTEAVTATTTGATRRAPRRTGSALGRCGGWNGRGSSCLTCVPR
jgi:predicted ATPase